MEGFIWHVSFSDHLEQGWKLMFTATATLFVLSEPHTFLSWNKCHSLCRNFRRFFQKKIVAEKSSLNLALKRINHEEMNPFVVMTCKRLNLISSRDLCSLSCDPGVTPFLLGSPRSIICSHLEWRNPIVAHPVSGHNPGSGPCRMKMNVRTIDREFRP